MGCQAGQRTRVCGKTGRKKRTGTPARIESIICEVLAATTAAAGRTYRDQTASQEQQRSRFRGSGRRQSPLCVHQHIDGVSELVGHVAVGTQLLEVRGTGYVPVASALSSQNETV